MLQKTNRGNSPILIIVIVFVIAILGAGYYLYQGSSSSSNSDTSLPTTVYDSSSSDTMSDTSDDKMMEGNETNTSDERMTNAYVAYSPQALEEGVGKTRVLFFYANWCPTCIPVDKEIQANSTRIPEGTIIYRANYNDSETDANEEALADKYNVTYQHTFVIIDDEGNEVTKWNGGDLDRILSEL